MNSSSSSLRKVEFPASAARRRQRRWRRGVVFSTKFVFFLGNFRRRTTCTVTMKSMMMTREKRVGVCVRRPSLAAAQPSRTDRNRTTEENNKAEKSASASNHHPISEDVAFARMNKPNDFRLRNLFFQRDVSVYSSVTQKRREYERIRSTRTGRNQTKSWTFETG